MLLRCPLFYLHTLIHHPRIIHTIYISFFKNLCLSNFLLLFFLPPPRGAHAKVMKSLERSDVISSRLTKFTEWNKKFHSVYRNFFVHFRNKKFQIRTGSCSNFRINPSKVEFFLHFLLLHFSFHFGIISSKMEVFIPLLLHPELFLPNWNK